LLLFLLYLVCYFLRQLLEAKLMGNEVGLSPLETLAAVYVGLELFGFLGFLLGPLGLLLIEDLTQMWAGTD
jgi:predicted PurR-regulated permease PerM